MSASSFDDFCALSDPLPRGAFRARFIGSEDCGARVSRAEDTPAGVVAVPWTMGRAASSDVIWTTCACPMIVSARVIRLLQQHRFTGWATYPVAVSDKRGERDRGICRTGHHRAVRSGRHRSKLGGRSRISRWLVSELPRPLLRPPILGRLGPVHGTRGRWRRIHPPQDPRRRGRSGSSSVKRCGSCDSRVSASSRWMRWAMASASRIGCRRTSSSGWLTPMRVRVSSDRGNPRTPPEA